MLLLALSIIFMFIWLVTAFTGHTLGGWIHLFLGLAVLSALIHFISPHVVDRGPVRHDARRQRRTSWLLRR
jgi:hypothetical protein